MRPSWVEVDLDAITANVAAIRASVAPSIMCAVVKADGYGHGDVPVAEAAIAGGAEWLAVALVEEGARLREAGIDAPILLLSEPGAADAAAVLGWDLRPTVYTEKFVTVLNEAASGSRCAVHVKVNTGMHRVGADPDDVGRVVDAVVNAESLTLEGLWTHLAVAEDDAEYTKRQIEVLGDVRRHLAGSGLESPMVHAANTAGALGYPEARLDMVRVGLGIYGLRPGPAVGEHVVLRPAMRVASEVTFVRELAEGERPSYGRIRPLPATGKVVTVPIGYADGVSRALGGAGGEVLIRGKRYPFAGNVTMDQLIVDVGAAPVRVGDEVVLLGSQGDDEITADEWAARLGTINYEVVCDFGPRLPRRYQRATGA